MEITVTSIGQARKITVTGVSDDILAQVFGKGSNFVVVGADEVEEALAEINEDINKFITEVK